MIKIYMIIITEPLTRQSMLVQHYNFMHIKATGTMYILKILITSDGFKIQLEILFWASLPYSTAQLQSHTTSKQKNKQKKKSKKKLCHFYPSCDDEENVYVCVQFK